MLESGVATIWIGTMRPGFSLRVTVICIPAGSVAMSLVSWSFSATSNSSPEKETVTAGSSSSTVTSISTGPRPW